MTRRDIDGAVAALAYSQCAAFSLRQVYSLGIRQQGVYRRTKSGQWLRETERVLTIPGAPRSHLQRLWIAHLDCDGTVSHQSAAWVQELETFANCSIVAVTTPHSRRHTSTVGVVHQTRHPAEPIRVHGLPVTPIDRTLVDLADVLTRSHFIHVFDTTIRTGRVRLDAVERAWIAAVGPRRPGRRVMAAALAHHAPAFEPPMSELNRALRVALDPLPGLPPRYEAPFPGRDVAESRVDACYDLERLIVEADSRSFHTRTKDFERDRKRDRAAARLGYATLRYTWTELTKHVDAVREEVTAVRTLRRGQLAA